jgi:hypothetical protein
MMKKTVALLSFVCLFILTTLSVPSTQLQKKERIARRIFPRITLVTQEFYNLAVNLVVQGTNFPPKSDGDLQHRIRLVTLGGVGGAKGEVFFVSGNRTWSSTKIEEFLSANIQAGRKYKVGLVKYEQSNPSEKTLISNEVEYLLLMNVDNVSPNPVPHGTTEVVVATANKLGTQGSKIVKVGNQQAQVLKWGGTPDVANFKIKIPSSLVVPGIYDLYVEENGAVVSNKARVRLQGP